MSTATIIEVRREAKRRNLRWADVEAAYHEVKAAEWEKRQRPNEVRETAWVCCTAHSPGCWPFWRHGFVSKFGRIMARGADLTSIPGYDTLAQEVSSYFPEYADPECLWDFLLSPYDRMPSKEELYRKALDLAEREAADHKHRQAETEAVPF